jgi:hypothetical protein
MIMIPAPSSAISCLRQWNATLRGFLVDPGQVMTWPSWTVWPV